MNLRNEIELCTPALRRFAHALTASSGTGVAGHGDDLVHETILRALKYEAPVAGWSVRLWLFATLVGINRQEERAQAQSVLQQRNGRQMAGQSTSRSGIGASENGDLVLSSALRAMSLDDRECVLLVALEGLSYGDVGTVLGIPAEVLMARLGRGRAVLANGLQPLRSDGDARTRPLARPASHLRLVK